MLKPVQKRSKKSRSNRSNRSRSGFGAYIRDAETRLVRSFLCAWKFLIVKEDKVCASSGVSIEKGNLALLVSRPEDSGTTELYYAPSEVLRVLQHTREELDDILLHLQRELKCIEMGE
jgi:hypothetical protein